MLKNACKVLMLILILSVHASTDDDVNEMVIDSMFSNITLYQMDTITQRIMNQFNRWRGSGADLSYLLDTALGKGIDATGDEIKARFLQYLKAFPNAPIDSAAVRREIIIEKYLTGEGYGVSENSVDELYEKYKKESPLPDLPDEADIWPLLQCIALFSQDAIQLTAYEKQNELMLQVKEMSPPEREEINNRDLRLDGPSESCLVYSAGGDSCIVSVEEFNNYLDLKKWVADVDIRSKRMQALRMLLGECFTAKMYSERKRNVEDAVKDLVDSKIKDIIMNNWQIKGESAGINGEKLFDLYSKYYNRFFNKRIVKTIAVIGATDSEYVDSVYRYYKLIEEEYRGKRLAERSVLINKMPWSVITSEEIECSTIDTMSLLSSAVIKLPYGYFLCRVVHEDRRPEKTFKEAYGELVYLYQKEYKVKKGVADSVVSRRYYEEHISQFKKNDTIMCELLLTPNDVRKSCLIDKTMLVKSCDLRGEMKALFEKHYTRNFHVKKIGPIESRVGTVTFNIQDVRKSEGFQTYEAVRQKIDEMMSVKGLPFESVDKIDAKTKLMWNVALKRVCDSLADDKIDKLNYDEVGEMMDQENMSISSTGKINDEVAFKEIARGFLKLKQKMQNSGRMYNWMKTLEINENLLYSGCKTEAASSCN